jgi:hypothetical protein
MGFFGKNNKVSAGGNITNSPIHQGDIYNIGGASLCPEGYQSWKIGSNGTCGCCRLMNSCKEGRAFVASYNARLKDDY